MFEMDRFRHRLQIIKQSKGIVCRIANIVHNASSAMYRANMA